MSDIVKSSKFLSLLLRHKPEAIGLTLDSGGWAHIDEIITKSSGRLTRETIERVVAKNDKQRFVISEDGARIRANQGHSVPVELGLVPKRPPFFLYHGTHIGVVQAIQSQGLLKMSRHHVHLTGDQATAKVVGKRRGDPVVFRIDAERMYHKKHDFFLSDNGVWLTEAVPAKYLQVVSYRKGRKYTPADILPHVQVGQVKLTGRAAYEAGQKRDLDGDNVNMASMRLQCFSRNLRCVACNIEGQFFVKEKSSLRDDEGFHLNLYALDPEGNEVLMTRDHIHPLSKGGLDVLDNVQTMCSPCNGLKADT